MASEFVETTLGSLLEYANGRSSPDRAEDLPYPVYGSNGIIGYASETNADAGTIVIGRVGSYCGSLYLSEQPCWVTDNAIRATALDDNDPRFLFYLLCTLGLNDWRAGSGQPLLNQDILSRIPATAPGPLQQRAIARILGTLDDKIELNRRMNETLEGIARALFKSWFIDFDPVRARGEGRNPGLPAPIADLFAAGFSDSELGEIPEGWAVGTLGDVAQQIRRSVQPGQIEPGTPYIALEHMPKRCIALSDWGIAHGLESNKFRFQTNQILFGKLRPYFHKVGVAPIDGVCSTDIVVVAPKSETWFGFALEHMSSDAFVEHTDASSTGTKMPRTNWEDMARYPIAIPHRATADAFTRRVRPLIARITAAIHESRTLAALRDALLPKLVSGELRVSDAECTVSEAAA